MFQLSLPFRTSARALVTAVSLCALALPGCSDDTGGDDGDATAYDIAKFDAGSSSGGSGSNPEAETFACNPCTASLQCDNAKDKNAKCLDYGKAGAFCGRECASDADCPGDGYSCKDATTVEGAKVKQCVAKAACTCSAYATAKGLSTYCSDGSGCDGEARCVVPGAAPECKVKEKTAEICDALDNDCDGEVNEGTCDDGNLCTDDSCVPFKGCVHLGNGNTCDDGSKCTKADKCADGKCVGTEAVSCDDGKVCTVDSCDKAKGCVHKDNEGGACDDGDGCTTAEKCVSGKCAGGSAKSCDDGNACTDDSCKSPKGTCAHAANSAACDDGNACTLGDKCGGNACLAGAVTACDDNEACTNDSCDPKSGCVNAPAAATPCNDGDACTEGDSCAAGKCKGNAKSCDDKDACTDDSCDPKAGCKHANNTASCDDGDKCTEKDVCSAGKCAGVAKTCDDNNKCTQDSCDNKKPVGGECVNLPLSITGCTG